MSRLIWGTYGKDGKGPLKWKFLDECETDHLENIVRHMDEYINHYAPVVIKYMTAIKELLVERCSMPEDVYNILVRYNIVQEEPLSCKLLPGILCDPSNCKHDVIHGRTK